MDAERYKQVLKDHVKELCSRLDDVPPTEGDAAITEICHGMTRFVREVLGEVLAGDLLEVAADEAAAELVQEAESEMAELERLADRG